MFSKNEIELLTKYIDAKIIVFEKIKTEIANMKQEEVFEAMKDEECYDIFGNNLTDTTRRKKSPMQRALEIRHSIVASYIADISMYKTLKNRIQKGNELLAKELFELYDMCDNKERFDNTHDSLHLSIIKKIEKNPQYLQEIKRFENSKRNYDNLQRSKQCKSQAK